MKKLSNTIKKALTALAYQHTGEFLPMQDKLDILGVGKLPAHQKRSAAQRSVIESIQRPRQQKKIALVFDGNLVTATLQYAIDSCHRQEKTAQIDLLIHGSPTVAQISAVEQQITDAGIPVTRIDLSQNKLVDSLTYLRQQSSLISIVAPANDALVTRIVEEILPKSNERLAVPLVLVGGEIDTETRRQSAA